MNFKFSRFVTNLERFRAKRYEKIYVALVERLDIFRCRVYYRRY